MMNTTVQNSFLETANAIAARLCRDAIWNSKRCNWLGASMDYLLNNWTVTESSFGPDLYTGTSGIALFLGKMYQLTPEKLYRQTAEAAIEHTLSRLPELPPEVRSGFYSGCTGIGYILVRLGEIFDHQDWLEKGLKILAERSQDDLSKQQLDVVSGIAGAIPALLSVYQQYPQDVLLEAANRYGEYLLSKANKNDYGWSWTTLEMPGEVQQQDLTGFSHGAAGIAWALLELYQQTKQESFLVAAEAGFRYEQNWYNPQYENWPDLRNFQQGTTTGTNPTPSYGVAWCHGAPGIGFSRLRAYEILGKPDYQHQAEAAIRTTIKSLQQPATGAESYCLCHGFTGNTELLLYASRVLGNAEYKSIAEQVGWRGIEHYEKNRIPWSCGVMGGGETPGLMLGLAGIGYFYLRLYDPQLAPSMLIILPETD
ncbi:type 2 lanthipeptide synthetase LanM [Okeania sp. KiyG1]|uniref:type 2 lanthipeptide synthetase LanM n=1 Tax=Okeania sp. KiyG1 TaxID=2720165 RepID=UPI001924F2E8|nr:type 2 lanthipeptide synthetase LanM [Okeania sp. KiyG1]GFZ90326.1 hypothetical protein CYANOKiyG1_00640 [Okeania sp. KiyG1]